MRTLFATLRRRTLKGAHALLEGEIARLGLLARRFQNPERSLAAHLTAQTRSTVGIADSFRARTTPRFFIDPADKAAFLETFRTRYNSKVEAVISDADMLCRHRFCMLGARNADLGAVIDWHADFKSGARWSPNAYYKLVSRLRRIEGADVKVPWELSRFQHAPTLGKAYWLTGDEKYAREFVEEVSDWIARNPPQFGINWACTMDVAIRIANWLWGWCFFKDSPLLDDRFLLSFLNSVWQHGRHIAGNLESVTVEGKTYRNNHYLSDIAGLVYLGVMFPEFSEAQEWLSTGLRALEDEIESQVCDDGVDFELSVPYHRLALELFLYPAILCRLNGVKLSDRFLDKLERMFEFTAAYIKPDGLAPQIGDADDGRLHILSNYSGWEKRDHRYLLSIGGEVFGRDDFREAAQSDWEEAFWLTNRAREEGVLPIAGRVTRKQSRLSCAFEPAGYYIMRSRDHYMIVNAANVGTGGLGAHKHCDVLSFELCIGGTTFLVDPGTYLYTPDPAARNLFRSTAYHNTVQVDGRELNRVDQRNVFAMSEEARPRVRAWESRGRYDYLDAEHYGYCAFPDPIVHRREVYFDKEDLFWLIKDELRPTHRDKGLQPLVHNRSSSETELTAGASAKEHVFSQYFHYTPMDVSFIERPVDIPEKACDVIKSRWGIEREGLDCAFGVAAQPPAGETLICIPLLTAGLEKELSGGWVSPSYGVREEAPVIRFRKRGRTADFLVLLFRRPYSGPTYGRREEPDSPSIRDSSSRRLL